MNKRAVFAAVVFLAAAAVFPQDDSGFGFGDPEDGFPAASGSSGFSGGSPVKIGGYVETGLVLYGEDIGDGERFKKINAGELFSGKVNISASGSNAEAVINLDLTPGFDDPDRVVGINEAYVRAFFGSFDLEGGIRKLSWGKADSFGPLDVVNPLDYRDLSKMTDISNIKIARPMLHASFGFGNFKVEGVWVPWFEGHRFASAGRWTPSMVSGLPSRFFEGLNGIYAGLGTLIESQYNSGAFSLDIDGLVAGETKRHKTLEYSQGGFRFTGGIASNDFGLQYYSGFLGRPAVTLLSKSEAEQLRNVIAAGGLQVVQALRLREPSISYNRFHQVGLDYARVLAGFNLRAEFAANLTEDLSGDDGSVYNPNLAWSLGFDRNIVWGINANIQCNESVRLMNDKVDGNRVIDAEAGTGVTSTRVTFVLSKKLFRDELELKTTVIWGVEDGDCYVIPAAVWTKGDVKVELSGGIFGGGEDGELGQYRPNNFVKALLGYSF